MIEERVNKVFRTVFENPNISVNDTTTAEDIEGWDSITHLTLITSIESEFGISFTGFEIMGMQNVGDMIRLVAQKTNT